MDEHKGSMRRGPLRAVLGQALAAAREPTGLSQRRAAAAAGQGRQAYWSLLGLGSAPSISKSALGMAETGNCLLPVDVLAGLCYLYAREDWKEAGRILLQILGLPLPESLPPRAMQHAALYARLSPEDQARVDGIVRRLLQP